MKKVVLIFLAALMLCSLASVAFASTFRWTYIADTYANVTNTLIEADLGTRRPATLKITAQLYRYSSVADDYMRSVKFEASESNCTELRLYEKYNLNDNDKVVFTFNANGEIHTETCYA